ncbi:hypothetical protein SAMN05421812_10126 [Asanoa hainanensis]|uniref:Uncharacterized protein n=1 Tax=Asanoa hainanensis TaxID=560556 RepID=A0A239FST4_9ACTN|nr:hypothetical protein [Asanoa hainanensis]SNS58944.1 hypothetical protein SAMN05421812_10126 [Asanoa hainanensis]
MTDFDVVERSAEIVEATACWPMRARMPGHKDVLTWRVRGRRAVELMNALRPGLSPRRQAQIDRALSKRELDAKRKPYATEVAEMWVLKAAGVHRAELAERYGVKPKSVNALLRGDVRPIEDLLAQASKIAAIEAEIAAAVANDVEWAWLGGLLEGEGCFSFQSLGLHMTDEAVVRRAAEMMGGTVRSQPPRRAGWSPIWSTTIGVARASEIIQHFSGVLGARRSQQLALVLARRPRVKRAPRSPHPIKPPAPRKHRRGYVPPARLARNHEIARRLAAGEKGTALALEYGMTHQNVYHIGKAYRGKIG